MTDRPDIEGYSDLQRIACGGFGTVYRARQDRFGRVVALKVLDVEALDEAAQRRFERECLAMGSLSWHPNVVALHDSGITAGGRPYLVMEFLEAGSLGDRLADGPVAWPHAVRAGVEVAGALGAAHAAGTLHRDLKPENLLVGPFGETKLGDFGIAAIEGSARSASGVSLTIAHVAPEVLRGDEPDERADVYGLASTLHTLVAARTPIDTRGDLGAVLARVLHTPPERLGPDVPTGLADLLQQGLAKDPTQRPPDAASFGRALQAIQAASGHPITALRLTPGDDDRPPPPPVPPVAATARIAPTPPPPPPPPVPPAARPARVDGRGSSGPGALVVGVIAGALALVAVAGIVAVALTRGGGGGGGPSTTNAAVATGDEPTVVGTVDVGTGPEQVALTADAAWVVDSEDDTVSRIDPDTDTVVATIPVGASPFGIAATPEAVWVANSEGSSVSRIDPDTDTVVATVALRSFPGGIAADEDEVWVAGFDDGSVTRIDPATNRVADIVRVGPSLNGIALTPDAVWAASPGAGTVTRIDRGSRQVTATLDLGIDVQPNGVGATADAVWVTGFANDSVTRIDPATDEIVATIEAGNQVNGVAATETFVWVANQADGTITQIDVATDRVVATIPVGEAPNGIAADDEVVWVTNFTTDTATRVDPDGG